MSGPVIDHRKGRFHIECEDGRSLNTCITIEGFGEDILTTVTGIVLRCDVKDRVWHAEIHAVLPSLNIHNAKGEVFIHSLNLPDDHWLTKLREYTEEVEE